MSEPVCSLSAGIADLDDGPCDVGFMSDASKEQRAHRDRTRLDDKTAPLPSPLPSLLPMSRITFNVQLKGDEEDNFDANIGSLSG